jgi:hypothetical protein
MREITGNLWNYHGRNRTYVIIPINMDVKANGRAVMGRGIAAQAKHRFPNIDASLGGYVSLAKRGGRRAISMLPLVPGVLSFTTKNHWYEDADIELIRQSATLLGSTARTMVAFDFYLPRPGCGNGNLRWEDVRPVIAPLLPDNVYAISKAAP